MTTHSLYAIVDEEVCAGSGHEPVEVAEAFLRAGAGWIQLRAKHAASARMLAWSEAIAVRAATCGARFIVNDRADVARVAGAGVHVGQEDLPAACARDFLGPQAIVGVSTHNREQIERALAEPISYLAVGPVFGTRTKDTGYEAVGLALVREAVRLADGRVPVVAIGGITLERAPAVLDAGATAVAIIGDLMGQDPGARARTWAERLRALA